MQDDAEDDDEEDDDEDDDDDEEDEEAGMAGVKITELNHDGTERGDEVQSRPLHRRPSHASF